MTWWFSRRPFGTPSPLTFDIEWYADGAAEPIAHGYQQAGEVDAEIELPDGVLEVEGLGHRVHVWGAPFVPTSLAVPAGPDVLQAPYRLRDGRGVLQVLTRTGWSAHTVDTR